MYQITAIGQMEFQENHVFIHVNEDYKKGLSHAESFSHMHLVYGDFAWEENKVNEDQKLLKHGIVKVEEIQQKSGKIVGEIVSLGAKRIQEKKVCDLFDLKPYFPCEDRVITLNPMQKEVVPSQDRVITKIQLDQGVEQTKSNQYHVDMCGTIRVIEGQTYIECPKEMIQEFFAAEVVRVFWWFHRFDKKNFRKITECNLPYENAPRVGVFASRSPVRPNPIAMTTARILRVDELHNRIYVNSLDCYDQTPCINVLPYRMGYDYVENVNVGNWVEHWPKSWVEEEPYHKDTVKRPQENAELRQDHTTDKAVDSQELSLETLIDRNAMQSKQKSKHTTQLLQQLNTVEVNQEPCLKVYEAYENNLKGINVTIPYHKITAIVGVSGSGKSTLAFDTIYAECQRRFADLSGTRDLLPKPKVSRMTGVIPAVAITQQAIGKNARSTVGTYSDLYDDLRSIYATIGIRHCPNCGEIIAPMTIEEMLQLLQSNPEVEVYTLNKESVEAQTLRSRLEHALEKGHGACYVKVEGQLVLLQTRQMCYHCNHIMFHLTPSSFNYSDSESACKRCHGFGRIVEIDEDTIIQNKEKSLLDDASLWYKGLREFQKHPNANWMRGEVLGLAQKWKVDLNVPYKLLPDEFKQQLLNGTGEETVTFNYVNEKNGRNGSISRPAEGAIHAIKRFYTENGDVYPVNQLVAHKVCPVCQGERLSKEARNVTVGGVRYPVAAQMTFAQILSWCMKVCEQISDSDYAKIETTLVSIARVCQMAQQLGIDYLSLDRDTTTLSGGEKKRLKLLSNLATNISGILYIMDEPTAGLNVKDYEQLTKVFHTIIERRNTILMVEHNAPMILKADQIIEIGSGAGVHGGEVVENGPIVTGLSEIPARVLPLQKCLDFQHGLKFERVSYRNLKEVSFTIPLHAITCIYGVSGSGKSSMLEGVIYQKVCVDPKPFQHVCYVDQQPIGRNLRSTPATYLKLMDEIRKIFANLPKAKELGLKEAAFSYNSTTGQCDCCKGIGKINPEFMSDVWIPCPVCHGTRYKEQVLEVKYHGYTIADVLEFSVEQALKVFNEEVRLQPVLQLLCEVSLEYLILGQSTTTLSGGEAQRLKLVNELMTQTKGNTLYLLDEPTSGLSRNEVIELLKLFHRLIEEKNTIVLIEHNQEVLQNCDYQIELGPKAGDEGGRIISEKCLV
ncbi:MAG: TrmO family methyltransferase [Clostridiales bacterium]|nr:TrmO family methyltransferase [Clostridiales bacterium]